MNKQLALEALERAELLKNHSSTTRESYRRVIADYLEKRLTGCYRDRPIISDPAKGDIAPTCVAHYAKDVSTRMVADPRFPHGARPYTVREYARLQGVPDTFQFSGTSRDAYRQIGNGVSVPVGEWIGREVSRYFARSHS